MAGNNRDWGYTGYDVGEVDWDTSKEKDLDNEEDDEDDKEDDEIETPTLIYTSLEKSGSVNQYSDNGDNGHSHYHWDDKNDFDAGEKADWGRSESGNSRNPSDKEIEDNGGCYLTTACLKHFQGGFDDNCYHLTKLRWFRDNFVSKNDIKHYYDVAPQIVDSINNQQNKDEIYEYIFVNVVDACVKAIEKRDYEFAYERYKQTILMFEEAFVSKQK